MGVYKMKIYKIALKGYERILEDSVDMDYQAVAKTKIDMDDEIQMLTRYLSNPHYGDEDKVKIQARIDKITKLKEQL